MKKTIYCIKEGTYYITRHFRANEFKCKDGSKELLVCRELLQVLEEIRVHFNKPVIVNSGYRTPWWNTQVGGAKNSYHCKGMAADIRIEGIPTDKIAKYASEYMKNHGGVIRYTNFVHIDVREECYRKGVK